MGRIRTIKPEFFDHDGLFDLEMEVNLPVRLAFIGLWTQCDREGRFVWSPRRLKTRILPYDDVDFSRVLDALMTRGFVVKYEVEGRQYGVVPSFSDHQVINNREKKSEIPEPIDSKGKVDASATREPRDDHADTGEGKGKERKEKIYKKEFDAWYEHYPRKVGKEAAWRKYQVARQSVDKKILIDGVKRFREQSSDTDEKFIPHPATWLNQGRWDDEVGKKESWLV